jgi:hypothetical protein
MAAGRSIAASGGCLCGLPRYATFSPTTPGLAAGGQQWTTGAVDGAQASEDL